MSVWTAALEQLPGACRYTLGEGDEGGEPISRAHFLHLLRDSGEFADWYSALLADAPWPAFYWENPPLTAGGLDREAEFVLIDAPPLAGMPPDAETFRAHFGAGSGVVAFSNLGGDALLVAPEPAAADEAYPHLAAFLRRGPREQRRELWHATARAVLERIDETPLWLSTSGTGVAWLHVRLDSRPKYYQHAPYRSVP